MTAAIMHPLGKAAANAVCAVLNAVEHIPLTTETDAFKTVHLWPKRVTTTAEEVTALRAFIAVTDSPLAWHEVKP